MSTTNGAQTATSICNGDEVTITLDVQAVKA
jgi:hypothetical protein